MAFSILWIPSLIALLVSDPFQTIGTPHGLISLRSIGLLSVFGTVAAVFLFNIVIRRSSAIFASSVTYFIPMVAMLLGSLSGEKIGVHQLLGMAVVVSGVVLINAFQRKETESKE
jgi:drug/metabolite transporter (DMT)-like permease